jgi:hypothetical protein
MIDVYAAAGTFGDKHTLAQDLAKAVMEWEQVPEISLFKSNTAASVPDLPAAAIFNAAGEPNYVRVHVLTPANVLDRDRQISSSASWPTLSPPRLVTRPSPRAPGCWSPNHRKAVGASTAPPTPVTTSLPRHAPSLARSPQPPVVDDAAFPTLEDAQLAARDEPGTRRSVAAGEYLYREGDAT